MDILPAEINALIVTELSNSKVSLSSRSLAMSKHTPLRPRTAFRSRRPKHPFQNAQASQPHRRRPRNLQHLVSSASNLQELTLHGRTCMNDISDLAATSLRHTPRLRKISLIALSFPQLSDLIQLLEFVPHGTAFSLEGVSIQELSTLARRLRPSIADAQWDSTMHCPPWDTQDFEAPKPVPQITGIRLRLSGPHYLLFLDILSSPKTPFPNLQDVALRFYSVKRYVPHRLPALLERYRTSLRALEVDGLDKVPVLILPSTLEHFKWPVTLTDMKEIELFRQILESSRPTLKVVSLNYIKSVDKIIAEMDWKLAGNRSGLGTKCFPRSLKQSVDDEWRGGTSWV